MSDSNSELFGNHSSINAIVGGKRLTIKGEGSKKYLEEVTRYANSKIEEIDTLVKESGSDIGREKTLILAAINIADEMFKLKYFDNDNNQIYDYPQIQRDKERIEAILNSLNDTL